MDWCHILVDLPCFISAYFLHQTTSCIKLKSGLMYVTFVPTISIDEDSLRHQPFIPRPYV